jgi:hypothetical protein
MKKLIIALTLSAVAFTACKKETYYSFNSSGHTYGGKQEAKVVKTEAAKEATATTEKEFSAEAEKEFAAPIASAEKNIVKMQEKAAEGNLNKVNAAILGLKIKKDLKKIVKSEKFKSEGISAVEEQADSGKSQLIALLLCWLLGTLGVHRFYLGYTWQGVVQLLTAGVCGVWTLIDLVRIIMGNLQPAGGSYSKTL